MLLKQNVNIKNSNSSVTTIQNRYLIYIYPEPGVEPLSPSVESDGFSHSVTKLVIEVKLVIYFRICSYMFPSKHLLRPEIRTPDIPMFYSLDHHVLVLDLLIARQFIQHISSSDAHIDIFHFKNCQRSFQDASLLSLLVFFYCNVL